MAKPQPFVDPETGLKRQRAQRPEGAGERYRIASLGGMEIYHCRVEDCMFDSQWPDQFDLHYFHKHEIPAAKARSLADAASAKKSGTKFRF